MTAHIAEFKITDMKPRILSSRTAHQNKWYKVRHDELEWAPDKKGEYFVVEGWEGVAIVAVQDNKI